MAPAVVSKRGFLSLVLWVSMGRNGCRVIIRIETGHSNLVSCFGPRIRALARYFTLAFASVKYLSQRPHPRAKTWHKIWMTGLNPTNNTCEWIIYFSLTYLIPHPLGEKVITVVHINYHHILLWFQICLISLFHWQPMWILHRRSW